MPMHMKRNVWVAGTWKPGTEVHLADEIVVYRADFLEVPSGLAFFFINVPPYLDQVSDEFANDCDNKAWNFIVSRIHSPLPQDEVFVEFCQSHQINDTPRFEVGLMYVHGITVTKTTLYECRIDGVMGTMLSFKDAQHAARFMDNWKQYLHPGQPAVFPPRYYQCVAPYDWTILQDEPDHTEPEKGSFDSFDIPDELLYDYVAHSGPKDLQDFRRDVRRGKYPSLASTPSSKSSASQQSTKTGVGAHGANGQGGTCSTPTKDCNSSDGYVANCDDACPMSEETLERKMNAQANAYNLHPMSPYRISKAPRGSHWHLQAPEVRFPYYPTNYNGGNHTQGSSTPSSSSGKKFNAGNSIHIADVLAGKDCRTTIMLRNLPNTAGLWDVKVIFPDGSITFLYVRMDFETGNNVGYAFVDFPSPDDMIRFVRRCQGKALPGFSAGKLLQMSYATLQGRENLVEHFRNSAVMDEAYECRPHLFFSYMDGQALSGHEEAFPAPNNESRKQRSLHRARLEGLYPRFRATMARPRGDRLDLGHPASAFAVEKANKVQRLLQAEPAVLEKLMNAVGI